jgi:hypothetical protein
LSRARRAAASRREPGASVSSTSLGITRKSGQIDLRSSRRRGEADARMRIRATPSR